MIVETGHFTLILALLVAVLQCILPLIGAWRGWRGRAGEGRERLEPSAQRLPSTGPSNAHRARWRGCALISFA